MRYLLSIGLVVWLTACGDLREEVAPAELVVTASKLAVACFISPQDSLLTAKVSRSRPLLDEDPTRNVEIFDATVTLSDGQQTTTLTYDGQLGYYRADARSLPIRAGKTYNLTVVSTDGLRVTASATVPTEVPIQAVVAELQPNGNNGSSQLQTQIRWQDPPESANVYQVRGQLASAAGSQPRQTVVFAGNEQGFFSDSDVTEGQSLSATGYIYNPVGTLLTMELWHVTDAYYQYHRALALQLQTDGNPFAEPTPIPSNIQNGLGCFGAYNRSVIVRSLR
ncbi:DUF4249 domain-containing protein [Spirosoma pomorum]|jgi:hypothetical protein